jgi:hypothetical protein
MFKSPNLVNAEDFVGRCSIPIEQAADVSAARLSLHVGACLAAAVPCIGAGVETPTHRESVRGRGP